MKYGEGNWGTGAYGTLATVVVTTITGTLLGRFVLPWAVEGALVQDALALGLMVTVYPFRGEETALTLQGQYHPTTLLRGQRA